MMRMPPQPFNVIAIRHRVEECPNVARHRQMIALMGSTCSTPTSFWSNPPWK